MATICKELDIFIKTTKVYELSFTKNGSVVNLTDWTIYYTVKEKKEDTDVNAKIKKDITSHSDATGGKTLIELSTTDTDLAPKSYWYSIDYKDSDDKVGILFEGKVTFKKAVRDTRV